MGLGRGARIRAGTLWRTQKWAGPWVTRAGRTRPAAEGSGLWRTPGLAGAAVEEGRGCGVRHPAPARRSRRFLSGLSVSSFFGLGGLGVVFPSAEQRCDCSRGSSVPSGLTWRSWAGGAQATAPGESGYPVPRLPMGSDTPGPASLTSTFDGGPPTPGGVGGSLGKALLPPQRRPHPCLSLEGRP